MLFHVDPADSVEHREGYTACGSVSTIMMEILMDLDQREYLTTPLSQFKGKWIIRRSVDYSSPGYDRNIRFTRDQSFSYSRKRSLLPINTFAADHVTKAYQH